MALEDERGGDATSSLMSYAVASGDRTHQELVIYANMTSKAMFDSDISFHYNGTSANETVLGGSPWPLWVRSFVVPVFFGIVCMVGILGNSVVIAVLLRFTNMRTVPNIYILNLAFADLLFMFSIPFLAYQYASSNWIFGKVLCKIVFAVDGMNMFTGIFILTAMSIDRYFAIVHGITSIKYRTVKNARIVNCCLWCLSVLVTLPLWMYSTTVRKAPDRVQCDVDWPEKSIATYFTVFTFVLGFALPVIIISGCYLRLVFYIVHSQGPQSENPRKAAGSRRVALLVITVVAIFVICWLPFYVIQFVLARVDPRDITLGIYITYYVSLCLGYANSSLNPLVYTFAGENFRKNLLKICRRHKRRKIRRGRHRVVRKGILKKASRMNHSSLVNFSANDTVKYEHKLGTSIEMDTTTATNTITTTTDSCHYTLYHDTVTDTN